MPNLKIKKISKKSPESSQGTLVCFTCNYRLEENQTSEQELEPNSLFPRSAPSHLQKSPVCLLFGHMILAQLAAQQLGGLNGAPLETLHSLVVVKIWLGGWRCWFEPLEEGTAIRSLTSWMTALINRLLCKM